MTTVTTTGAHDPSAEGALPTLHSTHGISVSRDASEICSDHMISVGMRILCALNLNENLLLISQFIFK
ncbi:hypothetical protein HN011_010236 [Eciton burchellii]|nr:hypothetical protein HN011_010236 [Eciton burchellii]